MTTEELITYAEDNGVSVLPEGNGYRIEVRAPGVSYQQRVYPGPRFESAIKYAVMRTKSAFAGKRIQEEMEAMKEGEKHLPTVIQVPVWRVTEPKKETLQVRIYKVDEHS